MRRFAVALAGLVLVGTIAAPATASTADLIIQVDGLVKSFPGDTGVYIADPLVPQPLYTHDVDVPFIAASLYKLGILAHVETLVDTGTIRYTDTIEIQPEDITDDGSYENAGTVMTIDEALEAMITLSDNGTALAFWHQLGPDNINATLQKLGLADFHVASDDNDDNTATARVIGQYFTLLAQRKLVSAAASDRMLARLERQTINDRLPAELPEGTRVAHKTGNLGFATHDAGIIYTRMGARIVVGLTANTDEEEAVHFLGGLGALVYSAVLEPPATARYRLPIAALAYDAGSLQTQSIQITNSGTKGWGATGPTSVKLLWAIRDTAGALTASSPTPIPLPALAPAASTSVTLAFTAPAAVGDYTLTVGLADANGNPLAAAGAATGSFSFHVHVQYLVSSVARLPQLLHRSEASMLIVQYSNLPTAGAGPHTYSLFWQAIDPTTSKSVASGTSPLGAAAGPGGGTFYSLLNAPAVRGTYKITMELREGGKTVSETQSITVEIAGPRSYPDDRDIATQPAPRTSPIPRPSGATPAPRPSPSGTPRGRASPTPRP
ncbi:MAG: class A beta-lactamase-related serine hydrolase [Chloroflexota bacterium]|nr:class A beta-lactamase-related serine hydrolase [Chloroflexota bacterium]